MKLFIRITSTFIICFLNLQLFAQQRDIESLHHTKRHDVATHLVDKGSYYNAIEHLTTLAKEFPKNKKYITKLAEAYFMSRDYANAEIWYLKAVELDGKITTPNLYKLAETQKYNGKYTEAKANFQTFFDSKYRDSRGEKYKLYAENEIASCDFALKHFKDTVATSIKHLGDTINSAYTDFSPSMLDDSTMVFASLQSDSVLTYEHDEVHFNHTKLYKSKLHNEEWTHPEPIEGVNTIFENNANGSLSSDGKRFYFSRCFENLKHKMICNIYVSEIDAKGNFGKPKKLPHNVNKSGYNNTQPVVARHKVDQGKEIEVLYFSSNRNGGKGGFDIWYSEILPKRKFKNPINLGKEINSIRDEITPFYDSLSGNLYFSSNYHYGFGGYDIFRAKGQTITWSNPVNVLLPYNSNVDDTYYIFNKKQNKGFFVSNRVGGINLKSATCCDDIYGYTQEKPLLLVTHTYDKDSKALLINAKELILTQSKDTVYKYNNIEGQYLYNKVISSEIYKLKSGDQYSVVCIDSGKVIENVNFTFNHSGEITNTKLSFDKDSISSTKIEDSRFDIVSLNIFIHKDITRKPVEIAQKVFDKKEQYFIDTTNTKPTKIDTSEINQSKNTLAKAVDITNIEIAKTKTNVTVNNDAKKDSIIIPKSVNTVIGDNQQIRTTTKIDSIVVAKSKAKVYNTSSNTLKSEKTKLIEVKPVDKPVEIVTTEKSVRKINVFKNVKRAVLVKNVGTEIETISNTSNIDSIISYLQTSELAYKKGEPIPDIKMIVQFGYNEEEFIIEHKKMLDSIANFLIRNPQVVMNVEAHTDNVGSKQYNIDLSYKRAKTIVNYFSHLGISRDRLIPKWHGENKPLVPNQNADGTDNEHHRHINRRAELKFYNYKKNSTSTKKK